MENTSTSTKKPVVVFDIDSQGNVTQQLTDNPQETTLERTLLEALFPDIKVAIVNVPTGFLDGYEESVVANAMAAIQSNGTEYRLVGASGAAKEGKFYLVDADHAQAIARRFQHWPEAAIVYFGILVSPCRVTMDEPNLTVLAVDDHQLGTNDCRGWIRRSLFCKLQQKHDEELLAAQVERLRKERFPSLPAEELDPEEIVMLQEDAREEIAGRRLQSDRLYQFRMAFEATQAKGCFKVMEDDVADLLEADIVLPVSSIKPELRVQKPLSLLFHKEGKRFHGRVVLGIRDVSDVRTYGSSYQLIENAPEDSIQLEILPESLRQVRKFQSAIEGGDYTQLLELLCLEDGDVIQERTEMRLVEAALLADANGAVGISRFPYVNNQLNKTLARWAFRTVTGGGLRLPGFALADDGYLFAHNGRVYAGSDWIPRNKAIVELESGSGLCVRYPIRSIDDLLPLEHLSSDESFDLLANRLEREGCADAAAMAEKILHDQLWLHGVYVLHSETAKKNGGDFDFDGICVVEDGRFPRFVKHCASRRGEALHQVKNKAKAKTSWFNLPAVAMKARGNQIGRITDLKTSCLAAGETDLARELVAELQKALDALKWNVHPDREVIDRISKQVKHAPWLDHKWASSISDLPRHVSAAETDRIGTIYNIVREEIPDITESKAQIAEFKMLFSGEEVTRAMYEECRRVNSVYAAVVGRSSERQERLQAECERASSELEEAKLDSNRTLRNQKYAAVKQAAASRRLGDERRKKEMKAINTWVRLWAASKQENRPAWVQALATVVSEGTGSGAILLNAFPQEFVDRLAQHSGGKAVQVTVSDCSGYSSRIDAEGRTFLIEPTEDGPREIFLFRSGKNGEIFLGTME
jgi:hypothetical protein